MVMRKDSDLVSTATPFADPWSAARFLQDCLKQLNVETQLHSDADGVSVCTMVRASNVVNRKVTFFPLPEIKKE
mgnify:CR=1 FL=1